MDWLHGSLALFSLCFPFPSRLHLSGLPLLGAIGLAHNPLACYRRHGLPPGPWPRASSVTTAAAGLAKASTNRVPLLISPDHGHRAPLVEAVAAGLARASISQKAVKEYS
ncbi:Os08g0262666 [Oryza sativa Japonica Group]|uniref:Os08g0262666 protein n=1 Tax=Oryza sativa subsp. japonica TaxID=39947 RepID=A0A0P0XEJ2_ORYSJ|nr:Os08g0262666 [Oryza sativa Japonica Group]